MLRDSERAILVARLFAQVFAVRTSFCCNKLFNWTDALGLCHPTMHFCSFALPETWIVAVHVSFGRSNSGECVAWATRSQTLLQPIPAYLTSGGDLVTLSRLPLDQGSGELRATRHVRRLEVSPYLADKKKEVRRSAGRGWLDGEAVGEAKRTVSAKRI